MAGGRASSPLPDPGDHLIAQPYHCLVRRQRDSNIPRKIFKEEKITMHQSLIPSLSRTCCGFSFYCKLFLRRGLPWGQVTGKAEHLVNPARPLCTQNKTWYKPGIYDNGVLLSLGPGANQATEVSLTHTYTATVKEMTSPLL